MMLLLMAGTAEARVIASGLAAAETPAIASLAGVTRDPKDLPIRVRRGGFGGAAAFETFLDENAIRAIIDATHPFASAISLRTADIAQRRGLPYIQVLRPAWRAEPGDNWTEIDSEQDAARHIENGATVFLATGRQTLPGFANLSGRRLICRQIDAPDGPFPYPNGRFLVGRPPFSVADEVALFTKLGIDWLIVKNAGGSASRTKLTAAAQLKIPVLMIRRPPQPDAPRVETAAGALDWARGLEW
ncbi:MAG: cobalt-precorrin-6A reductase [Marinosulfonomonas sp.]|nr:cobalt-precorrin-6A reductase [Marinosulfonomonas sp.]